jgi:hypothetical protein
VAAEFDYFPGIKFNGWSPPATGGIANLVLRDTHTIFADLESAD